MPSFFTFVLSSDQTLVFDASKSGAAFEVLLLLLLGGGDVVF